MSDKIEFTIQDNKEGLQDVGLRALVSATLIENGIKRAKIENIEENGVKVTVNADEVEKISEMKKILEESINLEAKKKRSEITEDFSITTSEIEGNEPLPKLSDKINDAFTLRQMCKFVDYGKGLEKGIKLMHHDLKLMHHDLGKKLDKLPERIAKAIKES